MCTHKLFVKRNIKKFGVTYDKAHYERSKTKDKFKKLNKKKLRNTYQKIEKNGTLI